MASWKTQLMCVSSGDRGGTGQLTGIRAFWKAISASESQKYDSLSETHMQIQCWQFNLHVLGLWKNFCADLLSKNISCALSKHKVLITIICDYMGVLVWKKTKGKTLASNKGKQKAPERTALVLPAVIPTSCGSDSCSSTSSCLLSSFQALCSSLLLELKSLLLMKEVVAILPNQLKKWRQLIVWQEAALLKLQEQKQWSLWSCSRFIAAVTGGFVLHWGKKPHQYF